MLGEECFLCGIGQDIEITGIDGEILHDLIHGAVAFNGVDIFDRAVADRAEFLVFGAAFFFKKGDLCVGGLQFLEVVLTEICVGTAVAAGGGHFLNGNVAVVGSLCNENARGRFGSPIVGNEEFAVDIIAGNELHAFGDLFVTLVAGAEHERTRADRKHQCENFFEVHDFDFLSVEKSNISAVVWEFMIKKFCR